LKAKNSFHMMIVHLKKTFILNERIKIQFVSENLSNIEQNISIILIIFMIFMILIHSFI
jgi:copper(I)-binding protein